MRRDTTPARGDFALLGDVLRGQIELFHDRESDPIQREHWREVLNAIYGKTSNMVSVNGGK